MGPGAELSTYALSVLSQGCRMELRMGQKEQWATDQGLLPELFGAGLKWKMNSVGISSQFSNLGHIFKRILNSFKTPFRVNKVPPYEGIPTVANDCYCCAPCPHFNKARLDTRP